MPFRALRRAAAVPVWWRCFAALAAIGCCWALAMPLFSGPDEGEHVVRAAAVARGHLSGREVPDRFFTATEVDAPAGFVLDRPGVLCYVGRPNESARCAPPFVANSNLVTTTTYVGDYPPLYYLIVGWPSLFDQGRAGVFAMRALSALASAAMLATAFVIASRRSRSALLGTLVAATPFVLYLGAMVNPNGLETTAAIATWTAACALFVAADDAVPVVALVVPFVVLANMRGLSIAFALLAIAVPVVLAPRRARSLLARRDVRVGAAVCVASLAPAGIWMLTVGRRQKVFAPSEAVVTSMRETTRFFRQMFGVLGFLDVHPPLLADLAWVALLVAVGVAAWRSTVTSRIVIAGLIALTVVVPVVVQALVIAPIGSNWQGRYGLPLAVGIVIVGGFVAGREMSRRALVPLVSVAAAANVVVFVVAARRYSVGAQGPLLFVRGPHWSPPFGWWALCCGFVLVAAVNAIVFLSLDRPSRR